MKKTTPMKIAIEAQRIFRKKKHGMDFVILECIRELQKMDTFNEYFIYVSPGEDVCLKESKNVHIVTLKGSFYPIWEQYTLAKAVNKLRPDILHCTSNTAPILCKVPLVLTLHDIIFLEPKQNKNKSLYQQLGRIYRRIIVPRILPKCKKIITVSNFERNHIQQSLQLPEKQIQAIYNGYNPYFEIKKDTHSITKKYIPQEGYLFFLGNTDPKKNTKNTLLAYALYLKESKIKRPLLIADLDEPIIESYLAEIQQEQIKEYIVSSGYIINKDLAYIYNGAFAFLYTSFRESFGIPQLEAMACGTPMIASNTSAMPEVAGKGAILTDPYRPEKIAQELLKLENDTTYYQEKVSYGLERVKKFSWRKTTNELLKLYQEL
jgi:glycosyltransferase involved in cell wall biosynthesis